jgi:transcriptional regulator GlxA family with amidase domain
MHRVSVLALDGVLAFDLGTPVEVLGRARLRDGTPAYEVRVCAPAREVGAGVVRLRVQHGLDALAWADTVVVPGCADPTVPIPAPVREALRAAAARGARMVSICVGAFTLAAAGLLDDRPATTHWAGAHELARRYPRVRVNADVLYVDDGQVVTSAGAAAGLDLCLHLVRRDHGAAVAADAARVTVMPLEREGGQAQFIAHEPPGADGSSLEPLLEWLEAHLAEPLSVAAIAARASLSTRTLNRRFREQTGTTPLRWLHLARMRRAQHLLETTDLPIDQVAVQAGFGTPTTLRERFRLALDTTPSAYRQLFRPRQS